jgi:hypothetical protein
MWFSFVFDLLRQETTKYAKLLLGLYNSRFSSTLHEWPHKHTLENAAEPPFRSADILTAGVGPDMPRQINHKASLWGDDTLPPEPLVAFVRALARANFQREHPELATDLGEDEHHTKTGRYLRPLFIR